MVPDSYGIYLRQPLESVLLYPKQYIEKSELAEAKAIARGSRIVGYSFMRDELLIFCLSSTIYKYAKCDGISYSASETKFLYTHWIVLRDLLVETPAKFRSVLHHELAHTLAATYPGKARWGMWNANELAKEGCCSDLDRWTWHMQRVYEQMRWRDERCAAALQCQNETVTQAAAQ